MKFIDVFFVYRIGSACHVERAFALLDHILIHDRFHMNDDMLQHLAFMPKKGSCDNERSQQDSLCNPQC